MDTEDRYGYYRICLNSHQMSMVVKVDVSSEWYQAEADQPPLTIFSHTLTPTYDPYGRVRPRAGLS